MAQVKVGSFSSTGAAKNVDFGFTVGQITIYNSTAGGIFSWNSSMADASYFTVASGAYTASNGVTPLSQSTSVSATISNITAANPAVITVNDTSVYGFAAGDTIKVTEVADDLTGTTLNGEYTIASITATTITTTTNTSSGYSAYVSGGSAVRVSDSSGAAVALENQAIRGLTLGTGVVGSSSDAITYVAIGEEPVV